MIPDFFKIHQEQRIGYKKITPAELGLSGSHETHIGLANDTLTFLPNTNVVKNAIFIYKDSIEFIDAFFDRIENQDGSFRSLKMRIGGRDSVSLLSLIRSYTRTNLELSWYLLWFGLENQQIVFLLCSEEDEVFENLIDVGLQFKIGARRIKHDQDIFEAVLKVVINKFNQNAEESIMDAVNDYSLPNHSIDTQTKKFLGFDKTKAEQVLSEIGRQGEFFVDYYLSSQLEHNYISHYVWENKNSESGKPYDFRIEDCGGNSIYLDVKSTRSAFSNKIIFSNNEIDFAVKWVPSNHHKYHIYRIFDMKEFYANLQICRNPRPALLNVSNAIENIYKTFPFSPADVTLEGIKIGILPSFENLIFDRLQEIRITN